MARNGHPIVARVAITINFDPAHHAMVVEGGQYRFGTVNVAVNLNRSMTSYVPSRIPRGQESYYLSHEQGHMDLMGLFGRELEVNLAALRAPNSVELLRQAHETTDSAVANARMYAINSSMGDCQYDRDTNHGMNHAQQRRWLGIIQRNIVGWRAADFIFRT
ncbi:MAG: hypothetical protein QM757_12285 [Paludibaculum sp.]